MQCEKRGAREKAMPDDGRDLSLGPWLQLPAYLESAFWSQRTIIIIDAFAIVQALVMNHMLLKTFRVYTTQTMLLHERLAVGSFPVSGLLHLVHVLAFPESYKKDRARSTLINRLVRVALMGLTALLSTPLDAEKLAGALPGWQPALPADVLASGGGAGGCASAGIVDGVRLDALGWLHLCQLFKPVFGPLFVALGYSAFMLPFRLTVPVQLATLVLLLATARSRVCWYLSRPGFGALTVKGCQLLRLLMLAAPALLMGQPLGSADDDAAVCGSSISALMVLWLFLHVVLLVLLPCAVAYGVEYVLKAQFARSKSLRVRLPVAWPGMRRMSLLLGAAAVHVALLFAWVLSELGVRALRPDTLQCDAARWLVRRPA